MDEHHSWYNGSVWHIDWLYQVYVGQWPIFYDPAILLHIKDYLMEKCCTWDNGSVRLKDRPCKIYVGWWPIFHGPLILPYVIVIDKLFLYIMKPAGGICALSGTCSSLLSILGFDAWVYLFICLFMCPRINIRATVFIVGTQSSDHMSSITRKLSSGLSTRLDSNPPVQLQRPARGLNYWI